MEKISRLSIYLSVTIIIFCFIMLIPINFLKEINSYISSYISDLTSYLSMLFAAFALLMASLAFKLSVLRPKLNIDVWSYRNEKNNVTLVINKDSKIVPNVAPKTSIHFRLNNFGKAVAKYTVVEVKINKAFFLKNDFEGWKAIYHQHAYGYYGFRWETGGDKIIYPNLPEILPPMYLSGKFLENPSMLEITIIADGFDKKNFKIPINIEYVDY